MRSWTTKLCALAVIAPLALGACKEDGTGPSDVAEGTYTLESVNGEALPTIVHSEETPQGTAEFRAVSGEATLSDGNYDATLVFDLLLDGQLALAGQEVTSGGTYTVSGNQVTIVSSDPDDGTVTATLSGDVLTMSETDAELGTLSLSFRRQ